MKVKIKIIFLGHLPHSINQNFITSRKSSLFEIISPIESYTINKDSDMLHWGYSDYNIQSMLPARNGADILLAVTNVPLEDNYFARRQTDNRICITYYEMTEILKTHNLPLENLIFRVLHSVALIYMRYKNRLPEMHELTNFAHDETRGCVFDMNGIKTEIIYSLNKPQLCSACLQTLKENKISVNLLDNIQRELRKIKKRRYYQILDFIKDNPIKAIIISSLSAILLGIIGSILATLIWETWFKK